MTMDSAFKHTFLMYAFGLWQDWPQRYGWTFFFLPNDPTPYFNSFGGVPSPIYYGGVYERISQIWSPSGTPGRVVNNQLLTFNPAEEDWDPINYMAIMAPNDTTGDPSIPSGGSWWHWCWGVLNKTLIIDKGKSVTCSAGNLGIQLI